MEHCLFLMNNLTFDFNLHQADVFFGSQSQQRKAVHMWCIYNSSFGEPGPLLKPLGEDILH